jgi:DNA repair exonuclease SbcCD ATPase subunit
VGKYEDQVDRRRMEEMGTNFELFFSIFSRRKRSLSNALSKGRMTSSARAELEAADQALDSLQDEYQDLQAQKNDALKEAQDRWARTVGAINEVPLTPLRKDIFIEVAALVWVPVYLLQAEGRILEAIAI